MNRSVKSKTIRHDCHLLVRVGENHLKTLVFLLPLFKSNRHKLDSIKFFSIKCVFFLDLQRLLFEIGYYFLLRKTHPWLMSAGCWQNSCSQISGGTGPCYVQPNIWNSTLVHQPAPQGDCSWPPGSFPSDTCCHSVSSSWQRHLGSLMALPLILCI